MALALVFSGTLVGSLPTAVRYVERSWIFQLGRAAQWHPSPAKEGKLGVSGVIR